MSFADDLRKTRDEAKSAYGKQLSAENMARKMEQDAAYAAMVARAKSLMAPIEGKCQEAAAKMKSDVKIMHLDPYGFNGKHKDVITIPQDRNLQRQHLSEAAQMVYDRIVELKLKPVIKWDHDGVGVKDWYELYATW